MKIYRRIVSFLILAVIIVLSFFYYNQKENGETSKEALKGKIEIITDEIHKPQLKLAADRFKLLHEKVNIDIIVLNDIENNVKSILNNSQYDADIITVNDSYIKYVLSENTGKFLEVTNLINPYKSILLNNKINNNSIKGKVYAMPWDTYPKAVIYRKDIFLDQGIDAETIKTWSDYIEVGRKINKNTGKIFAANALDGNSDIYLLLANQLGTSYFNEKGELDFQSSNWSRLVEVIKILYGEGLIKDFNSKNEIVAKAQTNEIVSFIGDPVYVIDLMKYSQNSDKWGIIKLPAFESGGNRDVSLGGVNLLINKNTSSSNLVQEFIKFTLTDDKLQMDLLNQYGRFPVNMNVYNFVDFNKNVSYFNNEIWNLFASIETGAFSINYTKEFPKVRKITENTLTSYNIKIQDFKTIVESIESSVKHK
ncbi:ABC transporter substrate-binding protein [Clostridium sp. BJN0013]|uniref:ABC transporter substrate-binding protein n=1 Tax=Clostridium sp. BJN0013 TaxID=3236840 RepID=UPI0034C5FC9E